jgi:SH3-like domain-containing protein
MHYSVLAVRTRNYADQSLNVYSLPDKKSKITAVIKEETEVRFKKINKGYVLILFTDNKGKNVKGWIKKDWLCGNPVTNCN